MVQETKTQLLRCNVIKDDTKQAEKKLCHARKKGEKKAWSFLPTA